MSEIQVGQINSTDGSTAITTGAGGYVSFAKTQIGGRRNLIINGAMVHDQRNGGSSITPSDNQYSVDRWNFGLTQASKFTAQQSTEAPAGYSNSILVTSSSAYSVASGDLFRLTHLIEGFNSAHLNFGTADAETITLSFWVRSSLTGTFGGSFVNSANNRSYPFTYTISSSDTWEKKTVTVAGDTSGTWIGATNGIGIRLHFGLGAGATYSGTAGAWASGLAITATGATSVVGTSGATLYITGVQLEVGTVATPFEHRSYGEELALCQRYAKRFDTTTTRIGAGPVASSTECYVVVHLPVEMRANPSLTVNALGNVVKEGVAWYSNTSVSISGTGNQAIALAALQSNNNMSAQSCTVLGNGCDILFDAEL